jgi:thiol:disulfide interchange protein DsbD
MPSLSSFFSDLITRSPENMGMGHTLLALLVAYLGGILASLTPCVYPMIPITVSIVGGMGPTRKTWKEISTRGMSYVAGMTLIYSFLGVLAGVSGKVFGSMTNTSGWYLFLGLVMTVASLWMMDLFYFDPAVFWSGIKRNWIHRQAQATHPLPHRSHPHNSDDSTWIGAFFLGASSGFIAAPCTTPVLTGILAYIAKTQSVGLGFCLMVSFSLGLGTLLLAVTLFTGSLQLLPKSGQWMKTIKIGSGLILLAFAELLIYRAGTSGGL